MKKMAFIFLICIFTFSAALAEDKCAGKEWELDRAIQVAPTNSTDPKWPRWKAKLGICTDSIMVFTKEAYFKIEPSASLLSTRFGATIHSNPWHVVPEKSRTFYVFEIDWKKWRKQEDGKIATITAVNMLLLTGKKSPVIYTPENPMSGIESEGIISLSEKSWQQTYPNGTLFVQIEVRIGGAKVKFLQKFANQAVPFAVYRDIPVYSNWSAGEKPFALEKEFPGYSFGEGFALFGEQTHWSAEIYLP